MDLKLLQLNIYQGKQYIILKDYLKKEDFDILSLQEFSGHKKGYVDLDIFEDLKLFLNLKGEIVKTTNFPEDKKSYFGNGILYKKTLDASNKKIIWMKPFAEIPQENDNWPIQPRAALSLDFTINGKTTTIIDAHMVWGKNPLDDDYKFPQADILLDYIKTLKNPFILTGDFNLVKETEIMKSFSKLARDLASEKNITNTLNPNIHRLKYLFPKGLAIDYIFVSNDIKVKKFKLIDTPDLSDHYGLSLTFEA